MLKLKPETRAIIWDFDGVILNSNEVRDLGFIEVLKEYNEAEVKALLDFHQANGGLSRYVKFEYFFKQVLKVHYSQEDIQNLAKQFSLIMKGLLTNKELLIQETLEFIQNNQSYSMHIVSGSDGEELRFLCKQLGVAQYFKSIDGSPTPKVINVKNLVEKYQYQASSLVLIGDSVNDYDAANDNHISFYAYNNKAIDHLTNYH
jgi:phosphoglycolate phosphatase-like HAD superfamily hydrolase